MLIDPEGTEHYEACATISAFGAEHHEAGLPVPSGILKLIVNNLDADEDWSVEFEGRPYLIVGQTPYLKRRVPRRNVLACEPRRV